MTLVFLYSKSYQYKLWYQEVLYSVPTYFEYQYSSLFSCFLCEDLSLNKIIQLASKKMPENEKVVIE